MNSVSGRIEISLGDITKLKVDAIVNAANTSLLGGGGVDGAIHRAAGPELLDECRKIEGCPTGESRITGGHRLPARHVIHTVGPVWTGGGEGEPALLESCYANSLRLAAEQEIQSMAFPCISTGVFGYPKDLACDIAVSTVTKWLRGNERPGYITFCCYSKADKLLYEARMKKT
jgi:O-acetyl-ADP-ribose deacetylase (regulator of RNase III)